MGWIVNTAADNTAADSLTTLKDFMRVSETAEDTLIQQILAASALLIEDYTRLVLLTQTWNLWIDRPNPPGLHRTPWWNGTRDGSVNEFYYANDYIELNKTPAASISSFKYYSPDGTENTFSSDAYRLDLSNNPNRVVLKEGYSWPANVRDRDAFNIEIVLGFGAESDIPYDIKNALRAQTLFLYENRGCGEMKLADNVKTMLEHHIQYRR